MKKTKLASIATVALFGLVVAIAGAASYRNAGPAAMDCSCSVCCDDGSCCCETKVCSCPICDCDCCATKNASEAACCKPSQEVATACAAGGCCSDGK